MRRRPRGASRGICVPQREGEPEPLPSQGAPLVEQLLEWLKQAKLAVANSALRSKVKDEKRGEKIIPGYVEAHGAVDKHDAIVKRAFQDAERVGNEVEQCGRFIILFSAPGACVILAPRALV